MGYVLDLIFGDPHGMWHPICFIGNMISFFERRLQSDCVHEQVAKADCERPLYRELRRKGRSENEIERKGGIEWRLHGRRLKDR